ncbi:MAG TPA: endonuclease/exonuclease/phosphatase family protein [Candidatus Saccharimonadales bacterium]|jgi:endonuclease/exonuclease/phosphatase family metal-dependent hydrolase|nr:endonuclease/exonuclease/phosphatase family protein [Candidatus Saccharimonadales bacterium]
MSSQVSHFTLATANTHFADMIRASDGLKPLQGVDILTFQEVIDREGYNLEAILAQAGFTLIHVATRFGLAIAIRSNLKLKFVPGSMREYRLQKMGLVERRLVQRSAKPSQPQQYTERGLIAAKFVMQNGQELIVATTHPVVPIMPHARRAQIIRIGQLLDESYFDGQLILSGDMNHYPKPRPIDKKMRHEARLLAVDLNNEPTWYARGSKQEKYLQLVAYLQRRQIEDFNGQHDTILYRGGKIKPVSVKVADIVSDHRAIIARFSLE